MNKYMGKILVGMIAAISSACTGALAEKSEVDSLLTENESIGVVREFGPVTDSKVGLIETSEKTRFICKGSFSKSIAKFVNLTIKVKGKKNDKGKCLDGEEYEVLKMASGRPAVIGKIKAHKGYYKIDGRKLDGSAHEYKFKKIPKGLKSMKGKKVILDALPGLSGDGFYKIVSYMLYPNN